VLILSSVTFRRQWFAGNFGVVAPGRVYRSAQPTTQLGRLIQDHRLASVLNLRGGSMGDAFYWNEVHLTAALGVEFYDFPMSATRRPSRRELLGLSDLFTRCRYPLLIHCRSGSDRTGLASALYLMLQCGAGPDEALQAFTLAHGHIALGGTQHLHEPLDEYSAWLRTNRLPHSAERFVHWVEHDYASDDLTTTVRPRTLRPGPRQTIAGHSVPEAGAPVTR
jgi:protein tyrosine phosphatase (PTP) superfamily phosphohydrolase (DUF442 family)